MYLTALRVIVGVSDLVYNQRLFLSPKPDLRQPCGSVDMAFASDCPGGSLAQDLALPLGLGAFTEFLPQLSALKFSSELWRVWQSPVAAPPWLACGGPHSCVTFLSMGVSFYVGHHCSFLALPFDESPCPRCGSSPGKAEWMNGPTSQRPCRALFPWDSQSPLQFSVRTELLRVCFLRRVGGSMVGQFFPRVPPTPPLPANPTRLTWGTFSWGGWW